MNCKIVATSMAFILVFASLHVQAQDKTSVRKPVATRSSEVRVNRIEVTSKADNIPVLVAKRSARQLPQWATASGKPAGTTGSGMSLAAPPKGELENLTLTVRKIYTPHGNLMFRKATINSDENYAFWGSDMDSPMAGTVSAALHVTKGKRYLLDFKMHANEFTTFGLNVGDSAQDITVNPGDHHLLVYLDATESTRVVARVNSDKANYRFESLQVTRVD